MNIYRKTALDRLSSPEQLDKLLYVVPSLFWLALTGIGILFGIALAWGLFGTLPITVPGTGVLTRVGETITLRAEQADTVKSALVDAGASVTRGQPLLVLTSGTTITSPLAGRVLNVTPEGAAIQRAAPLVTLESTDDSTNPLLAIVYVDAVEGQDIAPGMDVQLSPTTVRAEDSGYLRGRVSQVNHTPVSPERISRIMGSAQLGQALFGSGTYFEVMIDLLADPNAPSGLQWSSPRGVPFKLQSGTVTAATFVVGQQRPINLLYTNRK